MCFAGYLNAEETQVHSSRFTSAIRFHKGRFRGLFSLWSNIYGWLISRSDKWQVIHRLRQ